MGSAVNVSVNKQTSETINKHLNNFESYVKNKYETDIQTTQKGTNTINLLLKGSKTKDINLSQKLTQAILIEIVSTVSQAIRSQNDDKQKHKVEDEILQKAQTEAKTLGVAISVNKNETETRVVNEMTNNMIQSLESMMKNDFASAQEQLNEMNIQIIDSETGDINGSQSADQSNKVTNNQTETTNVEGVSNVDQGSESAKKTDTETKTTGGIPNSVMAMIIVGIVVIVFVSVINARKTATDPNFGKNLEQAAKLTPQGKAMNMASSLKGGYFENLKEIIMGDFLYQIIAIQVLLLFGLLIVWVVAYHQSNKTSTNVLLQ